MKSRTLVGGTFLFAVALSTVVLGGLFQNSPEVENRLDGIRQELTEVKPDLEQMACCIEPSCNFCPLASGKCPCGANVKSGVGVCGECYDGWRAGAGHVAGVQPENVSRLDDDVVAAIYATRAEQFGDGSEHEHEHEREHE